MKTNFLIVLTAACCSAITLSQGSERIGARLSEAFKLFAGEGWDRPVYHNSVAGLSRDGLLSARADIGCRHHGRWISVKIREYVSLDLAKKKVDEFPTVMGRPPKKVGYPGETIGDDTYYVCDGLGAWLRFRVGTRVVEYRINTNANKDKAPKLLSKSEIASTIANAKEIARLLPGIPLGAKKT